MITQGMRVGAASRCGLGLRAGPGGTKKQGMRLASLLVIPLVAVLSGCGEEDPAPGVMSRFDPSAGFFDAPFPIAHRAGADGSVRVSDFPNPVANEQVVQLLSLIEEGTSGFSLNAAIYVPFDGAVDVARLPADPRASIEPESTVMLVDIDPASPELGKRIPIETSFKAAAETYSPANLLV